MTVNERLIAALSPLGFPVVSDLYTGDESEYITFNYATRGVLFADDAPGVESYFIQVHFLCAYDFDYVGPVNRIKRALFRAGFTWPEMVNATGDYAEAAKEGRHYVFECELAEGVDDGEL